MYYSSVFGTFRFNVLKYVVNWKLCYSFYRKMIISLGVLTEDFSQKELSVQQTAQENSCFWWNG